jgi:oligogalacturonide lyase
MLTHAFFSPAGRPHRISERSMESSVGNRAPSPLRLAVNLCAGVIALVACAATAAETSYPLEVFPPEHKRMTDSRTGAELLFLTTAPETNLNLYFHDHSWLADESVILFTSSRAKGGLMGYLTETGELIRFNTPQGRLGGATAAARGNALFAVRGRNIVEIKLAIHPSSQPATRSSRVTATERVLCSLPDGSPSTSLNPSCDGKYVALGVTGFADATRGPAICKINVKSGKLSEVCRLPQPPGYGGHVQWSRTNPNLISFAGGRGPTRDVAGPAQASTGPEDYAGSGQRLWVVDIREGVPRNVYRAEEGELVTHESWWVNDQILFCGGKSPTPAVLSHVKVLNPYSGEVRIAGAGAWWPEASPSEAARLNWWHAAGSADGRWIAADNWHGDIMLFEGKTTRPHLLTSGHRTYGQGEHPHVGWDRKGKKVVFGSHLLGNLNVCVAAIPKAWQDAVSANNDGLGKKRK